MSYVPVRQQIHVGTLEVDYGHLRSIMERIFEVLRNRNGFSERVADWERRVRGTRSEFLAALRDIPGPHAFPLI